MGGAEGGGTASLGVIAVPEAAPSGLESFIYSAILLLLRVSQKLTLESGTNGNGIRTTTLQDGFD